MKTNLAVIASALLVTVSSCGNNSAIVNTSTKQTDMSVKALPNARVQIIDDEAYQVIDSSAVIEDLGEGFVWSEGPLYIADGDYVIFSDVPANKIFKWKEGEGISTYLDPSGFTGLIKPKKEPGSNGLVLDAEGNLVLCQHGDRRMGRMQAPLNAPKADFATIADRFQGKRLNSPNDAVYHSNGDLYFTDPPYGLDGGNKDSAKELGHHGVYRVRKDGTVDLVTSEFDYPNGIALSPDEKSLFVAHSNSEYPVWMKYELDENGLAKSQAIFYRLSKEETADPGMPDGMKVNSKGYVFGTGPGGIWIFNPSGKLIARIHTGKLTANCAFSKDEKTLYMTCHTNFAKIALK